VTDERTADAREGAHPHEEGEDWRFLAALSAGCLVFWLGGWVAEKWLHLTWVAQWGYVAAYLCGGWDAAIEAWGKVRRFELDVHFLMLSVAIGAALIGAWHEGALLLFLFSAAGAMEHYAMSRTRREIDALLRGSPKTARVLTEEGERIVEVSSLRPGMVTLVTDGEQIPADLLVLKGESACDESNLTGESAPVSKHPGDTALAGTLNVAGVIEGRVLRSASESALSRIIRLIQQAQQMKAPAQRFTDRFGSGYTWTVLGLCFGMFFVWWLVRGLDPFMMRGETPSAFYRAMTLLVVMSPCALVLSVPSAILSAIADGARRGVLFRGGVAVETLAQVRVVALDKTGTITTGNLRLTGIECIRGTGEAARWAATQLARLSEHPLSRAIRRAAADQGGSGGGVEDVQVFAGKGIAAVIDGERFMLGSRSWIEGTLGVLPGAAPRSAESAEVWLGGESVLARFVFQDELRVAATAMLEDLHRLGLRTVMLTGDRRSVAENIAGRAGVGSVEAELLPDDKVRVIERLKEGGRVKVAMIGDGVNDAPCIAAADVGVAMGVRGSDAALEQADVVLMNDRLEAFLLARELSCRARSVIRQNIVVSLGTVAVMATGAFLFPLSIGIGVLAHEGSTFLVVLNGLRLLAMRRGATAASRDYGAWADASGRRSPVIRPS
jgi:Cd2+/Zn2+-exporting ATPase